MKQDCPQTTGPSASTHRRRWAVFLALAGVWFAAPPASAFPGVALSVLALPVIPGPPEHPGVAKLETKFVQVHPGLVDPTRPSKSKNHDRAVVLIHGYWFHINKEKVSQAQFKDWQKPGSVLVSTLAKESDVFAFAYGQCVGVEDVAQHPSLEAAVATLKKLGYRQIVLVGHSAGGLVARYFVEDFPDAGVAKVVQVCSPNGGCTLAQINLTPKNQRPFLKSLTKAGREQCLHERSDKKVPAKVQFVCVVGAEDAVVPCACQWSKDLQDQGVPAVRFTAGHRLIVRKASAAEKLAEVVRDDYPRWDAAKVAAARKTFFKPKKLRLAPPLPSLRSGAGGSPP